MVLNPLHTWIKICGITSLEDALVSVECGADAVGFVFAESKRRMDPVDAEKIVRALPDGIETVGVFMDEKQETVHRIVQDVGLDAVQLHGSESVEDCRAAGVKVIKRFDIRPGDTSRSLVLRMEPYPVFANLLDPGAGDGVPFDWNIAVNIPFRLIVAGGLTPQNVREVIRVLHPFGVDVSTGVEAEPGKKDKVKIKEFVEEVRNAEKG